MGTIGFYVAPGFQMLDLAGPAGAFEAANDHLESPAYRLHVLAADKGAATSSLGAAITAASLDDTVLDTLSVTGGWKDSRSYSGPACPYEVTASPSRRARASCPSSL